MPIFIKDFFKTLPENERDLAVASDEIWKLGSLGDIKAAVSPELFIAQVSINTVGNWQCDGWESIISYHPDLFPYIPQALDAIGHPEIKTAFQDVIELLPDFLSFSSGGADVNALYCDAIKFLANVDFKLSDERFNNYSTEERAELSRAFNERIEILENLSVPLFKWDCVINYIKKNHDK